MGHSEMYHESFPSFLRKQVKVCPIIILLYVSLIHTSNDEFFTGLCIASPISNFHGQSVLPDSVRNGLIYLHSADGTQKLIHRSYSGFLPCGCCRKYASQERQMECDIFATHTVGSPIKDSKGLHMPTAASLFSIGGTTVSKVWSQTRCRCWRRGPRCRKHFCGRMQGESCLACHGSLGCNPLIVFCYRFLEVSFIVQFG